MPVGTVTNGLHRAVVQPRQEEQDDHGTTHHDHAPELGVNGQHQSCDHHSATSNHHLEDSRQLGFDHSKQCTQEHTGNQGVHHFTGDSTQHRIERGEVPHGSNVQRRHQRICGDEVVVLEEVATKFGREENHRRESQQKHRHAKDIVHGVVRVERHAIQRLALGISGRIGTLDFNAVWVVGAHVVQRQQVRNDQAQQNQRNGNDVEAEEAVQGSVAHHKVATD